MNLKAAEAGFLLARKSFGKAKSSAEIDCEQEISATRLGIATAQKLIEPVFFDASQQETVEVWSPNDWSISSRAEVFWLQPKKPRDASMSFGEIEFPKSFDLKIEIGMIDKKGQIDNEYWKFYAKLLIITLLPSDPKSPAIEIMIERNPKLVLDRFAHVSVNGKSFDGSRLAKSKNFATLQASLQKENLTVLVESKEVAKLPASGSFKGIMIKANCGLDGQGSSVCTPAISRLSLAMRESD